MIEHARSAAEAFQALLHDEPQQALAAVRQLSDVVQPEMLFCEGRSHLMLGDYSRAEQDFHAAVAASRNLANPTAMRRHMPLLALLSQFYLGA